MPITVFISLGITLLYVLFTINKNVYSEYYLNRVKIDILSGVMLSFWLFTIFDYYIGTLVASIISTIFFSLFTFVQYSVYITNKMKDSSTVKSTNEEDSEETVAEAQQQEPLYTDPLTGRTGKIKNHLNGNFYLGTVNMGTEEEPVISDILLYNEDGFSDGDSYQITGIDGPRIVAKKI